MKIRPLEDRIVVKPLESKNTSKGGIVLPESAKEKPQQGEVVAVGAGKVLNNGAIIPLSVKKGDRIIYGQYSGTEVKIEEKDYLIMKENEVLAKVE